MIGKSSGLASFSAPVDTPPVSDLHDHNGQFLVIDGKGDSVITLPDPILLLARQLLTARWPRILGAGTPSVATLHRPERSFLTHQLML